MALRLRSGFPAAVTPTTPAGRTRPRDAGGLDGATTATAGRLGRGLRTVALALCALSMGLGPSPVSAAPADNYLWSFTATPPSPSPGTSVTLTATVAYDVGPTPYWIEIFDLTTGQRLAACSSGRTCSAGVFESDPKFRRYQVYITYYTPTVPACVPPVLDCFDLQVSWSAIAVGIAFNDNGALIATAARDVEPTPYWIDIFNMTTGHRLAACGLGTSCSATPDLNFHGTMDFQAFIAARSNAPPTDYQGASRLFTLYGHA
jgi:hypothetical protein